MRGNKGAKPEGRANPHGPRTLFFCGMPAFCGQLYTRYGAERPSLKRNVCQALPMMVIGEQNKCRAGGQRLADRMAKPDRFAAKEQGQDSDQNGGPDDAARERHDKRPFGSAGRLPERDHQALIPPQAAPAELLQAFALHEIDQFQIIGVENREEIAREKDD